MCYEKLLGMEQLLGTIILWLYIWCSLWMGINTCRSVNVWGMDRRSNRLVHVQKRCGAVRVFDEELFLCQGLSMELFWNWSFWRCRRVQRDLVDVWKRVDGWVWCHNGVEDDPIIWVEKMDHRRIDWIWRGSYKYVWILWRHCGDGCEKVHIGSLQCDWWKQFDIFLTFIIQMCSLGA